MKKYFPFISFILILSFVLPFFPCFSVLTKAEDSVSSDDAYIKWEKDNIDSIRNGLAENGLVINNDYYDDSYYYVDPEDNLWRDILRQWGLDGTDFGKPLSRVAYDYAVSNNITNTQIYNDCFDSVYNYVNSNVPYYIYHTMPVSDFFTYFIYTRPDSDGMRELETFKSWFIPLVNSLDGISTLYVDYYIMASDTRIVHIGDLLDNYSFALSSGSFGNFPNLVYQTVVYNGGVENQMPNPRQGSLNLYSNSDFLPYDGYYANYNPWAGSVSNNTTVNFCYVGAVQDGLYASWHCFFGGSLYLTPDSVGSVSFPVFKSSADMQLFYTGRSTVYSFDPDIDITGQDVDLSKLYDVIRQSVSDSEGDIINAINDVANDYLADQLELLGDIKNALNDSFGRSWLRKIHDQLADYFPQTLVSLSNLKDAINNLTFGGGSGGVADLSTIESDLSTIKGLLILQTAHDIIDDLKNNNVSNNDFSDVVTVANTKFPFSIPNDIVTILSLFVANPVEPEFSFPVPFANNNETFDIDISFIGSSLPYIRGAFIVLFILFLVVVSVKVINSLKE